MKNIIFFFLLISFVSCDNKHEMLLVVEVENTLNMDRAYETIELDISKVDQTKATYFKVLDITNIDDYSQEITSQLVDENDDGIFDFLLFQPEIKANSTKRYGLTVSDFKRDTAQVHCYSRFVPERTDDYAWENNRVAFRTYGPVAQKMVEDGVKGGTLSSGIDAWLKRVDYPIINKWYAKHTKEGGSYHEDTGEGLDNFHVGISRGVGGTALKVNDSYYSSKNFTSWKTITTGPIRTSFVLTYADWDADGKQIQESKSISLDYGQNLSRFEIQISGTDTISAGLTLHEKDGQTSTNQNWISYWEVLEDSELGMGLVTTDAYFINSDEYIRSRKDESNLYANLNVVGGKTVYYAGFGWKKSGQFSNEKEWKKYLSDFSNKVSNPLVVKQIN